MFVVVEVVAGIERRRRSAGQTVTVSYTDPSSNNDANAVQDSAGNDAASVPFTAVTNQTVSNVGPVFASATGERAPLQEAAAGGIFSGFGVR